MASLLNRSAVKKLALEEAKKRTDVNITRVSPDFTAKVESAVQKFVAEYVAMTQFSGKTIS